MLLPLKPICDAKKIRRDGTTLIYIQYCFSPEGRTLLNTEIGIPRSFWNKRRLCISKELPLAYSDAVITPKEAAQKIKELWEERGHIWKYSRLN